MISIYQHVTVTDPTGQEPDPWKFSQQLWADAGIPDIPGIYGNHFFGNQKAKPGQQRPIDWDALEARAKQLPLGLVMLNLEGADWQLVDGHQEFHEDRLEQLIEIVKFVREKAVNPLKIGYYKQLPDCSHWQFCTTDQRREKWEENCRKSMPLAKWVDVCFLDCYASSPPPGAKPDTPSQRLPPPWTLEEWRWHIHDLVQVSHDLYDRPAYVMLLWDGCYDYFVRDQHKPDYSWEVIGRYDAPSLDYIWDYIANESRADAIFLHGGYRAGRRARFDPHAPIWRKLTDD